MFNDQHYNYTLKQMVITRIYKFSLENRWFLMRVCNINRNMHKYLIKTNKLICKVHQFILLKNSDSTMNKSNVFSAKFILDRYMLIKNVIFLPF